MDELRGLQSNPKIMMRHRAYIENSYYSGQLGLITEQIIKAIKQQQPGNTAQKQVQFGPTLLDQ